MKKIIKRIVDRIRFSYPIMIEESLTKILEEELPDFQRIDEERFKRIYASKVCDIGLHIKEYNSTLPPALIPLPKDMPTLWHDAFIDLLHNRMQPSEFYLLIRKTYGTPQKQNLPSVEELAKEVYDRFRSVPSGDDYTVFIAQHLHDKYSLPTREWWQGDIKGMKVKLSTGEVKELDGSLYARTGIGSFISINAITPYTPPSAQDIIAKHNLSEEEIKIIKQS